MSKIKASIKPSSNKDYILNLYRSENPNEISSDDTAEILKLQPVLSINESIAKDALLKAHIIENESIPLDRDSIVSNGFVPFKAPYPLLCDMLHGLKIEISDTDGDKTYFVDFNNDGDIVSITDSSHKVLNIADTFNILDDCTLGVKQDMIKQIDDTSVYMSFYTEIYEVLDCADKQPGIIYNGPDPMDMYNKPKILVDKQDKQIEVIKDERSTEVPYYTFNVSSMLPPPVQKPLYYKMVAKDTNGEYSKPSPMSQILIKPGTREADLPEMHYELEYCNHYSGGIAPSGPPDEDSGLPPTPPDVVKKYPPDVWKTAGAILLEGVTQDYGNPKGQFYNIDKTIFIEPPYPISQNNFEARYVVYPKKSVRLRFFNPWSTRYVLGNRFTRAFRVKGTPDGGGNPVYSEVIDHKEIFTAIDAVIVLRKPFDGTNECVLGQPGVKRLATFVAINGVMYNKLKTDEPDYINDEILNKESEDPTHAVVLSSFYDPNLTAYDEDVVVDNKYTYNVIVVDNFGMKSEPLYYHKTVMDVS